ncbi:Mrp/NBP35 family ATP-binding protein [Fimbriimonas ginsengisoli]|uniref:Iron-sulfur cluster carrier protein n=1 Tax=Fimbriimonas ginsengisoli Gsoil 348 TaxID=661478 RepID=A0A068NRM9_FIMGI|nr:Mrp/NBP35 family ATP-binding protein [Fimbriimonas ginsengisoli]AIE86198.1 mrP protein [Fimbriimonas ginsengisoli Gsoil 348]
MPVTESQVLEALRNVVDPDLHRDIATLGFVKDLVIEGGNVSFTIELTTPACPVREELQAQAEEHVRAVPEVTSVRVTMTAQVRQRQTPQDDLIPGVKHCIAIASGKGGVGKSTVTVNLAIALAQTGAKVGLMDADVYGPSIPLMMGAVNEKPFTQGNKIIPIQRYGIHMMSLGFLLEEGQAVLWRGPMVAGTVRQLLADVAWGDLDYLLVDLPPGTGDAPMSLAQLAPLTGVVIVTTPHHVAANIAGKSVQLFRRLNAPIMGVVENMAGFVCPHCGEVSNIFAGTSGEELSTQLKVPYLGSVPLDPGVSDAGDRGVPAIIANPERPQAQAFKDIAGKLAQQASILAMTRRDLTKLGDAAERPKFVPG